MKAATATGVADESAIAALLETSGTGESLLRNTLEHAPIGIAFANRDGCYRHANHAFCAMLESRPYRPASRRAEARAELLAQAGRQFDAGCARAAYRVTA